MSGAASLLAEMAALAARDYPEIGVPALLIGEDLTAAGDASIGTPRDRAMAATLARMAETLASRGVDLGADDIVQLMELLADRHFLPAVPSFSRADHLHPPPAR